MIEDYIKLQMEAVSPEIKHLVAAGVGWYGCGGTRIFPLVGSNEGAGNRAVAILIHQEKQKIVTILFEVANLRTLVEQGQNVAAIDSIASSLARGFDAMRRALEEEA